MPKVGVILSGCGKLDGSEIHEAVLTLLYLNQAGVKTVCMAPDMDVPVYDHITSQATKEKRNVLVESARIARGDIVNISKIDPSDLDALILPGGFGAAINLSDFALKGANATVHPEVQRIIEQINKQNKPIGAICIAPATLAKALSSKKPEVTIGNDISTASNIEGAGGKHINCSVDDVIIDKKNNLVSTPAYMLGPEIKDIAKGIEKLVKEVIKLIP